VRPARTTAWLIAALLAATSSDMFKRGNTAVAEELPKELTAIHAEAEDIGQQDVIMPIRIFALARQITDQPDTRTMLAYLDSRLFDHDNKFVRRVAYTAIRFMGQRARDTGPDLVDRRIVSGMSDDNAWVRYDAAWAAGLIRGDDKAYAAALADMIARHEADPAAADAESAEGKGLARARESLVAIGQQTP
jgi:hypothetical protein